MLSILIPTYNYNIVKLVKELHQQAMEQLIDFEIIVMEDGSSQFLDENREVLKLEFCKYIVLDKNIGRSAIRNKLADTAIYEHLLFMDCDAEVCSNNFISRYISFCNNESIVLGGRLYNEKYLTKWNSLIFEYGKTRENNSEIFLKSKTKQMFTTPNFLIPKVIFCNIRFDETIKGYGHEDTVFGIKLKALGLSYTLIDNPVIHTGLERNEVFLNKTKNGVRNLFYLSKNEKYNLVNSESKLLAFYLKVNRFKLTFLLSIVYSALSFIIEKNLYSQSPSLLLFDLYKLLYLCKIAHSK